ncbi:MAG: hypothetical protein LV479_05690 [Methylacidiphilales bacterium]|nr:hypothetical protein [Candidatus Methylacidiphilales bacterium]
MIQWTLVAAILLLIFGVILLSPGSPGYPNQNLRTQACIEVLTAACQTYLRDNGPLPRNIDNRGLAALLTGENPGRRVYIELGKSVKQLNESGELVDAWGTPLRVQSVSSSEVAITSAGPDRIFGTADDITNQ